MQINITPEMEKFVQAQVNSGMYHSANEVFMEALHLLAEKEALQRKRKEEMNAFIQKGLDSAVSEGWLTPEEFKTEMDKLFDELEQQKNV